MKRFFECLLPSSNCNLKCDYCYVIQEGRNLGKMAHFQYSPEYIRRALSVDRLGGICYFSICAAGETLLSNELIPVVKELLHEGHFVNITTNGTITKAFEKISEFPKELLNHLHFAFSLHYIELKQRGLLDVFAKNVKLMKHNGCSILVQMNLYDKYIPLIEEIFEYSIANFGAKPQLAATRNELSSKMEILTDLTVEEYFHYGNKFESPLFDFTMQNFMVPRKEFCYAGEWSATLDITTGDMRKCYASPDVINLYENVNSKINFEAIGKHCGSPYCVNSSHFLSLGNIPKFAEETTYAGLRNRPEAKWYNDEMLSFLSGKLSAENFSYSYCKKIKVDIVYWGRKICRKIKKELIKFIVKS